MQKIKTKITLRRLRGKEREAYIETMKQREARQLKALKKILGRMRKY